jgi:hypothetical protein
MGEREGTPRRTYLEALFGAAFSVIRNNRITARNNGTPPGLHVVDGQPRLLPTSELPCGEVAKFLLLIYRASRHHERNQTSRTRL